MSDVDQELLPFGDEIEAEPQSSIFEAAQHIEDLCDIADPLELGLSAIEDFCKLYSMPVPAWLDAARATLDELDILITESEAENELTDEDMDEYEDGEFDPDETVYPEDDYAGPEDEDGSGSLRHIDVR
jgi:hypothetical protein